MVSICDAAQRLGVELKPGLQSSPFRGDKQPSFSVFERDGRQYFKDHAVEEHKGGVWRFVQLARPAWGKREIAQFLLAAAGLEDRPAPRPAVAELRRREKEREDRIDTVHQSMRTHLLSFPCPDGWSSTVAERYGEGQRRLREDAALRAKIEEQRGWMPGVVMELADIGLVSYPLLPWFDGGDQGARHGLAWRVDRPVMSGDGTRLEMRPVGYHQRWWSRSTGKSWLYVPHAAKGVKSAFQAALKQEGAQIPALPFVIGTVQQPGLVVILEGQWDAVTFYAANGAREDFRAAVFGLRGASSVEVFLAFYATWLSRVRPKVWLIGDADEAGRRWASGKRRPGQMAEWTFVDRLEAYGAREIVTSYLRGQHGGDFNDYYREAKPTAEEMAGWRNAVGL